MVDNEQQGGIPVEESAMPGWVRDALEASRVPAEFRQRCHEAAMLAFDIARLRVERERLRFAVVPLAEWVRGLAEMASVSLGPVLAWFGITDLDAITPASAGFLARLAGEIGFSLREVRNLLRLSFAAASGYVSAPLLAARRGETSLDELDACEAALDEIEARYPDHLRAELGAILREVREV
jgi:hypothetical protein